jgi:hypothetical protein
MASEAAVAFPQTALAVQSRVTESKGEALCRRSGTQNGDFTAILPAGLSLTLMNYSIPPLVNKRFQQRSLARRRNRLDV